jgi:hypothetical protein
MSVDRPIFIVAPPRGGTSILYRCIASHPEVGYFNRANRKFMHFPRFAYFVTRIGLYEDNPRESHLIWDRFVKGDDDVRLATDATVEMRQWYHSFISRVLCARGARRFVNKLPPNTLRLPWLNALFPDCIFVQIIRDWRAVVNSTMIKREKDHPDGAWFGPRPRGWRTMEAEPPEIGAAWSYLETYRFLEAQERLYTGRYKKVWYEDLCRTPVFVMKDVFSHCALSWSPEVEKRLPEVCSPSRIWTKKDARLTPQMIEKVRERFGDSLTPYEYPQTG